jgi:cytochrome P450
MTNSNRDIEQNNPKPYKLPPTPHINTRELVRNPLSFFLTLAQQVGDIVCYRPAPEPAYLLAHPDFAKHVLVDNNRNYSKATYINQMFSSAVGNGLLTSEGETWRKQRRLMQPAFHQKRINLYDKIITDAANKMLARWEVSKQAEEAIDIAKEMAALTLTITTHALFGVDLGEDINLVGQAVDLSGDLLEKPRNPRFQNGIQIVENIVYRIINERRQMDQDTGDLLSMLITAKDEDTGIGMDDQELRNQIITLLLAGYETTASALTWTWYLLSQHSIVFDRLRSEAEQVLDDRTPTWLDLEKLSYARMVFEEGLRLYPPAWVLGRKALGEDQIGGYYIPAETIIALSPYVLHRHPKFWMDPDDFDPERFSPERSVGRHKFAYLPFGAGPRQCIGNNLAMVEAQIILPMVSRKYKMQLVPDQDIQPEPIFILRPNRGILMNLE